MYKKRVISLDLQEVLDKLAAKEAGLPEPAAKVSIVEPTTTTYAPSDILKARSVLDRLLAMNTRNEVAYITKPSKEIEIDEE